MYLAGAYIKSPIMELGGDPNCFDPDWRHQAAVRVAQCRDKLKLPAVLAKDKEFAVEVEYIKAVQAEPDKRMSEAELFETFGFHHQMARWATDASFSAFPRRMNPLLLSDCPKDHLEQHAGLELWRVKLYHDFYFDVRTPDLGAVRGELMRLIIALGQNGELGEEPPAHARWMLEAAQPMGYIHLTTTWGLTPSAKAAVKPADQAAHLQALAAARVSSRLVTGRISTEDALGVINAGMGREKLDSDIGKAGGQDEGWKLAQGILQLLAPKLPPQTLSAAERSSTSAALQARRKAETAIGGTKVSDKGREAGMTDINERLRGRARDARTAAKEGAKK